MTLIYQASTKLSTSPHLILTYTQNMKLTDHLQFITEKAEVQKADEFGSALIASIWCNQKLDQFSLELKNHVLSIKPI